MEISPEKLGHKVPVLRVYFPESTQSTECLQIFEWRNENVAEADDLSNCS